jgi:hypothetical protein
VIRILWLTLLTVTLVACHASAAEPAGPEETNGDEAAEAAEPVVEEKPMTQGELAIIIVRMLGLEDEIDEAYGAQAGLGLRPDTWMRVYSGFLAERGVAPFGGWRVDEEVTKEVLAVVVVLITGLFAEVEDPTKEESYVAALEAHDIQLSSVRDVLSEIEKRNLVVQIVPGWLAGSYHRNLSSVRGR